MSKTDEHFSTMIQDTAKSSAILIIGQMVSTAISALGAVIVARLLGSKSYGIIAIATIPVNIALMTLNNGIRPAIIHNIVENRVKGNDKKIIRTVLAGFMINLSIGLIASLSLYLLSGYLSNQVYHNQELKGLIQILSLIVLGQSIFSTATGVLIGLEKMTQNSFVNISFSLIKTILGPALIFLGYGVIGASFGYSIPNFFSGLFAITLIYLNLRTKTNIVLPKIGDFRNLISYASPLFVSNFISRSMNQLMNFILPFYVSATLIGNLGAAKSFAVLIAFFLIPITTATFPLLSKLKPEDSVFEYVYQSIIKYETLIAYPIAAAVIALSGHMVEILYGGDFLHASLFIQVMMLNHFFIGFGSTVSITVLNSQKQNQVILRKTLIDLASGIPLGLLLIPRYGVLGYQATTIIAPILGLLFTIRWIRKNMNIKLDTENTLKILVSTILGYIACQIVVNLVYLNPLYELILGGTVLAIIYILSVMLTGALSAKNVKDIRSITNRYESIRRISEPIYKQLLRLAKD